MVDIGSTNGTYVNGRPVTSRRLSPGDRIEVGSCVLRYLRQGEADAEDLGALADLARRDALTGLANRRAFEEAAQREVSRARRAGAALAVVALDIDHFKRVNDTHGHAAGDLVLAEVAARAAAGAPGRGPAGPDRRRGAGGAAPGGQPGGGGGGGGADPVRRLRRLHPGRGRRPSTSRSPSGAPPCRPRRRIRPPCWRAPTPASTTPSGPAATGWSGRPWARAGSVPASRRAPFASAEPPAGLSWATP